MFDVPINQTLNIKIDMYVIAIVASIMKSGTRYNGFHHMFAKARS